MRTFMISVVTLSSCVMVAAADPTTKTMQWNFEDAAEGALPQSWSSAQTGDGKGCIWKIVGDTTAPHGTKVLAQTSESPSHMFNLCVADNTSFQDGDFSMAFKAVKGKVDQGGGLLWRYLDANNYYVARVNPLENNFRLFKVVNGKRSQLATKDGLDFPSEKWHTMRVQMTGNQIECSLDGKKYLEARDETFSKAGKVGFWTKADAQTYFTALKVHPK